MRLLCQNIGTRANKEDREVGKFFQGRYRAVRILNEATLLACSAYEKHGEKHGETWGHDTFMCGLNFLNLDLR